MAFNSSPDSDNEISLRVSLFRQTTIAQVLTHTPHTCGSLQVSCCVQYTADSDTLEACLTPPGSFVSGCCVLGRFTV